MATKGDARRGTTAPEEEQQQHVARILTVHMVICHTVRKLLLGLSSGFSPRLRTHTTFSGEFYSLGPDGNCNPGSQLLLPYLRSPEPL